MQRLLALFIALSLLLSACGTLEISLATPPPEITDIPLGSAPEETAKPKLSPSSSSEEIQQAMLQSATHWTSIWMDGTVTYFAMGRTDSQTTTAREQAWIDLPRSRFRILSGSTDGTVEKFKASDGMSVLEMDLGRDRASPTRCLTWARRSNSSPRCSLASATLSHSGDRSELPFQNWRLPPISRRMKAPSNLSEQK